VLESDIMAKATSLRSSIEKGNLRALEALLAQGVDPNDPLDDGQLPLSLAALKGNAAIVKALLEAGARPNEKGQDFGETALHFATSVEVAALLVTAGADVNAADERCNSPLTSAISEGNAELVKWLLNRGSDANQRANRSGESLLDFPCLEGMVDVVRVLLEAGLDPNVPGENDVTPLLSAALSGEKNSAEIARMLLNAGADPNAKMSDGRFPLYEAATEGSPELVQVLLDGGAQIDLDEGFGETALAAAVYNNRADTAALLLKAGADPHARISPEHEDPHRRGKTVVELAAASRSSTIQRLFKRR
jgi:cytohesin